MKTAKKVWIIIAVSLILSGFVVFLAALVAMNFDLTKINTVDFVTNTYTPQGDFTDISIDGAECEVRFLLSSDGICKVVCNEGKKISHTVEVVDNKLVIERHDNREWYECIGIYWGKMEIEIHLPKTEYTSLYLKSLSGDMLIPQEFTFQDAEIYTTSGNVDFNAKVSDNLLLKTVSGEICGKVITPKSLTVKSTSGDIELESIDCNTLNAETVSGEIDFSGILAGDKIEVKTVSGDIELDNCDANYLNLKSTSGEISGTLLTEKIFITDTTSGDIEVPRTSAGGKCEIKTVSGDIEFDIK